ncbi:MAG: hypothetical protein FWE34_07680 [Defluviitaleaceae bacterium]|nr:hypothetical protein [Defluviitaleaceae bacterium]
MNILNHLGANTSSFWHDAKKQSAKFERGAELHSPEKDDEKDCLTKALLVAVEEYKDKILRGLGGLSEDEIEEKVAEFEAIHHPKNETPENMLEFAKKVQSFRQSLARLAELTHSEMLLKPAAAAEEENNSVASFVRSQILSNAPRQII